MVHLDSHTRITLPNVLVKISNISNEKRVFLSVFSKSETLEFVLSNKPLTDGNLLTITTLSLDKNHRIILTSNLCKEYQLDTNTCFLVFISTDLNIHLRVLS